MNTEATRYKSMCLRFGYMYTTTEHRRLWTSILNTPTNGVTPPDSTSPASDGTENAESVKTTIEKAESLKTATEQLLKGYQQEVDALTRRAKAAESTFLTLLQLMLQQPGES